ncbi:MAG: transposase [Gammaproteobacteria bacterium]|nr:transposase [Gammaproteobacteria bacterium]NNC98001.1 transposase [Gammaproteobacteria bacterium]NNM13826.1 transposase [Gammaproteobacteria bacterium]
MSNYRRSRASGAYYFFTTNLADRNSKLLVAEIEKLRNAYKRVQELKPFKTIAICVLPDHIHAIWQLPKNDVDYSSRWRILKANFSRNFTATDSRTYSKFKKGEKGIWQRRFWEHQIRNETDLQNHINYIHYNPVKHGLVQKVEDWPHSSFHRFIEEGNLSKDWGSKVVEGQYGE